MEFTTHDVGEHKRTLVLRCSIFSHFRSKHTHTHTHTHIQRRKVPLLLLLPLADSVQLRICDCRVRKCRTSLCLPSPLSQLYTHTRYTRARLVGANFPDCSSTTLRYIDVVRRATWERSWLEFRRVWVGVGRVRDCVPSASRVRTYGILFRTPRTDNRIRASGRN